MKKLLIAPFLAALVMFVWGFLYYGISSIPFTALKTVEDIGPELDKLFPESGTYVIPDPRADEKVRVELGARGPFAMVHIHKGGLPEMDPVVMAKGFALEFVSCLLMVGLLGMHRGENYLGRVFFVLFAGVIFALFTHGGQTIWWVQDVHWHLRSALHDVVAWLGAGLVLAGFTRPND